MSGHPPVIPYADELKRKALHVGALVIPAGMLWLGREISLWILVPLGAVALLLDVARARHAPTRTFLHRWFAVLMRPEEMPPLGAAVVFNGATMMCVAAALTVALFPVGPAAAGMAMLMVGDGAAAVVGRRYGAHKWPGSPKSVEGTVAFAVTAFVVGLGVVAWPGSGVGVFACAVGAVVATVVEALPIPVNDNFRVPLAAAAAVLLVGTL